MKRLADQTLYEILEVPPDAAQDAVRAAVERARSIFGAGSLAMYSLMSPDEAELMTRRIEEAGATLLDPEARARYDTMLQASSGAGATAHKVPPWTVPPIIPARTPAPPPAEEDEGEAAAATPPAPPAVASDPEVAPEAPAAAAPAEEPPSAEPERGPAPVLKLTRPVTPLPEVPAVPVTAAPPPPPAPTSRAPIRLDRPVSVPAAMTPVPLAVAPPPRAEEAMPAFDADAPWTGEMLRKVREARGIPLRTVAERTKVTRHHLENIEADRFSALPAPVYLRGILFGIARELRLDGQKVARSYLERMAAALSPPPSTPGSKRG